MKQPRKWEGNLECDFCHKDVRREGNLFYDAKTLITGQWALMCQPCYEVNGNRIGRIYNSETLEMVRNLP